MASRRAGEVQVGYWENFLHWEGGQNRLLREGGIVIPGSAKNTRECATQGDGFMVGLSDL